MFLTIQTLFDDANIVSAIIRRVNQTRKDTIYWQQYLTFRRVTTRVFKDYIGSVTGVMAGSINSRFGEKPIRERRNIGSGYGEIAYLGDAYQMSIDRLSELQDLIDKFNAAKPADQKAAMEEIVNFLADDYRQITLAAHKRMDIIVGALLMLGEATVYNKDAAITSGQTNNKLLEITLPFNFIKPKSGDVVVDGKNKLSEQRAAAGSKGGRSSKKKTVQTAEKVITSTVLTAADKEANDDADNKENNTENNAENSVKCMKNTIEKSDDENVTENTLQCIDNECVNGGLQASFKQNFIREEKNREEKKNNSNKEKEITAVVELFKNIGFAPRQKRYINEIFPIRVRVDTPRTIPDLEERGVGPPMDKCISYLC